jgi:tRNA pseudouridine32 synthase/23S rRNA pseudouridine746 synthase
MQALSEGLVYVDEHLLVLDKPAGLLTVRGRGEDKRDCLAARAQSIWADAQVVHRLDMATSGLVLMARGAAMQRALSIAFATRRIAKRYVAVVDGVVAEDDGTIALPLLVDWPNRPRQRVDFEHGKPAVTRWRVLGRSPATTRLALEPVTGRTHQLRVHLQAIGHPILGDALYAPEPAGPRLLLHASALAFDHPATGEPLAFESDVPF